MINKGKFRCPGFSRNDIYFSELYELWLNRKIKPSKSLKTVADYKSIGRKHLLPTFKAIRIRALDRSHADQLILATKKQGLSNKTINKVLGVFKQILSYAELEGYCAKNPLRRFPALKVNCGRVDYLSQQEVIQLLRSNASEKVYFLLVLALNTGMRIGELTGLCWDRINFETDTIEVSRSLSRNGLKESTKTNLVRHIPMNPESKNVLIQLMGNQLNPKYVFVDNNGRPYNPDHFSMRHFQKSLERAGVRSVNFHVLRHTYASHFMMNGGNIYDLQKILGHTKVDMTMKYAHLSPQHLKKVVETVRFSAEGDKGTSPFLAPREKEIPKLHVI